jgi:NAD(P)-dependent dehydrogenase (short-subunit alcohol dehydrogenase family)
VSFRARLALVAAAAVALAVLTASFVIYFVVRNQLRATVDDCAEAAVFLCSDAARYITGEVITADGGGLLHTSGLVPPKS